jgi:mRNA interferase RelE/StbE
VQYRIEWKPSAARAFRKLPRQVQDRIRPRLDALASNPRPDGVKKLEADENAWRIRVGEFRVVYEIHDAVLMVMVLRVANRREAYR